MKKHILFTIIGLCPILFALTGCDKDEKEEPLTSVYQTRWEGTHASPSEVTGTIHLSFDSETTGHGTYKDTDCFFEYVYKDKIIYMRSSSPLLLFSRNWWIYKMTQTQLELRANPDDPKYSETLTLNRVY